jgi:hypothetical protein
VKAVNDASSSDERCRSLPRLTCKRAVDVVRDLEDESLVRVDLCWEQIGSALNLDAVRLSVLRRCELQLVSCAALLWRRLGNRGVQCWGVNCPCLRISCHEMFEAALKPSSRSAHSLQCDGSGEGLRSTALERGSSTLCTTVIFRQRERPVCSPSGEQHP